MRSLFGTFGFIFLFALSGNSQSAQSVSDLELNYKACLKAGEDTSGCGRSYLRQMDSTVTLLYNKVRSGLDSKGKIDLQEEQKSWLTKKSEFYKKQDENFTFHLQDGSWKPNMIWIVYEAKADYLKKRALQLAKRLSD